MIRNKLLALKYNRRRKISNYHPKRALYLPAHLDSINTVLEQQGLNIRYQPIER